MLAGKGFVSLQFSKLSHYFWSDFESMVFKLGILPAIVFSLHPPGNDKEIDSDLLPAALEGEPLVEVRRRVQQLHHLCLTLN